MQQKIPFEITVMTDEAFTLVKNSKRFDNQIWIGNSGASSHYYNDNRGLFDYRVISDEITLGNGDVIMIAEKIGKKRYNVM
jgi:hypothetical protein